LFSFTSRPQPTPHLYLLAPFLQFGNGRTRLGRLRETGIPNLLVTVAVVIGVTIESGERRLAQVNGILLGLALLGFRLRRALLRLVGLRSADITGTDNGCHDVLLSCLSAARSGIRVAVPVYCEHFAHPHSTRTAQLRIADSLKRGGEAWIRVQRLEFRGDFEPEHAWGLGGFDRVQQ